MAKTHGFPVSIFPTKPIDFHGPPEAHRDGLRASRAGPRGDDCQGRALPQDEGSRGFHGEFGVPP